MSAKPAHARDHGKQHYAQATRAMYLPRETNHSAVFTAKHNVTFADFRRAYIDTSCHPAVYALQPTVHLGFRD